MAKARVLFRIFSFVFVLALLAAVAFAQETTGGLQGTVRDPTSAVVANAHVELTGTSLAGKKEADTDGAGYYRFANLPPGTYKLTISAKGFTTQKREGLTIEVGHLPTVDFKLEVGASSTVVEVTAAAPVIDVTTNTNQTNITSNDIAEAPHGYTFQSVIQYAPMARNEPLAGGSAGAGTAGAGGMIPGSSGNGQNVGYSVGGGADSENQYLVEGQDTENISGGISAANVPFQFIQEMQVKSSGIEAEHGGALGGVVNVVMKKGSNAYHGSVFGSWEGDGVDGSWNRNYPMFSSSAGTPGPAGLRYDPLASGSLEPDTQTYIPQRDHFSIVQPGFTLGGPVMKDRLWFFLGFAPQYNSTRRTVNFGPSLCFNPTSPIAGTCPNASLGDQDFTRDLQQYFASARLDGTVTQKVRVFASWLYQYSRESGVSLPNPDPIASQSSYLNLSIFNPLTLFSHGLGFSAPNATYNVGADITLTPKVVSTTRFGYFFQNYHDFGWPTTGVDLLWGASGVGAKDNTGALLPLSLQQPAGTATTPYNGAYTVVNASKHWQFNEDVAFFKGGWWGTHNIKGGYQYNRLWNIINQAGNIPQASLYPGAGQAYHASTGFGGGNCTTLETNPWGTCAGQYGYLWLQGDFATVLRNSAGQYVPAVDNNHALFIQDAWTVGHGLTLNLGLRIEKETLPAPPGLGAPNIKTIDFSWSQKVEPRLGAAWGSRDGKIKIFGSYGVTNDVMKLLLAQTSFGAQGWDECAYPLGPDASGTFTPSDIDIVYNAAGRACPTAPANVGAVFASGVTPPSLIDKATGVGLLENTNLRPQEPITPGLNPYRQHEYVAGVDYQIRKNWAFEARYDRRRLDHAIEDASLADPYQFELYTIVNPGQGVDSTFDGYANYLTSIGAAYGPGVHAFNGTPGYPFGTCPTCPHMPIAVRNYDGLEFRLTKLMSHNWSGTFSYTWSSLWGNYAGLTTTDQSDGGVTGRNSPDTSRSFDEPIYYFAANGKSSNGPLPTDRPNALKGNLYYTVPWWSKSQTTTFGLFQVAYQGSPVSSFADVGVGYPTPIEGTYVFGRGKWANVTTDPSTGLLTSIGTPYNRRTPWFTQTDVNLAHEIKVNHNNEAQRLRFDATFTNLLNQHSVLAYWQGFNSNHFASALFPGGKNIFEGAPFYQAAETGYNVQSTAIASGVVTNALYGQPNLWQISRSIRFGASFTF